LVLKPAKHKVSGGERTYKNCTICYEKMEANAFKLECGH
jgi:hypothetical protein